MKATCLKNPEHKKFVATAHVMQEWVVDASGQFLEVQNESMEVVHGPDPGNYWHCAECSSDAKVEE